MNSSEITYTSNILPPSEKVSLDDLAGMLGLSKSTVSRALSGKGRISAETRQRVAECAEQLKYRPNAIAKSLAQSRTFNIGVVLPGDKELSEIPFFQTCLMGICEVTAALDYDVIVTSSTVSDISQLTRLIRNNKVDGVILTRAVMNDPAVSFLLSEKVPFVIIGAAPDNSIVHIDIDHESACSELMTYLISGGCKRPSLLIGSKDHKVNISRYNGYMNAFEKSGRRADESLVYDDLSGKSAVARAVADLLDKGSDCVVCGDDHICVLALNALDERGIVVPKNIKVASFYDSVFLKNHNPPVTAVNTDPAELGAEAGHAVYDLINGRSAEKNLSIEYEISIKKSTM